MPRKSIAPKRPKRANPSKPHEQLSDPSFNSLKDSKAPRTTRSSTQRVLNAGLAMPKRGSKIAPSTLIIKSEGGISKTGRRTANEKKYREVYVQTAAKNKSPIVEEEVEQYVYAQISQQASHKIEQTDHELIRHHIWDLGLQGTSRRTQSDKNKFNNLLADLLPNTDHSDIQYAGLRTSITNSVNNSRGIQRAIWTMCDNDNREDVASRIASLLFRFCARERDPLMDDDERDNKEILESFGIIFNPPARVHWNSTDGTIKIRD